MHGFTPGMSLLYALFGGNVLAFLNGFLLGCFVLAGLGAYQLACRYTSSFMGGLLIAFVYTFSSFHLAQWQDHYWYVINFILPWYLLYFPKVFDFHPRHLFFRLASWKYLFICVALGLISASLDYYTTFFLIYLSIFYALWKRYLSTIRWTWKPWKKVLTIVLAFFFISLLIDGLRSAGWDDNHGLYWSGDAAGLLVPQNSMLYGDTFKGWQGSWQEPGPDEKNIFLGFALIIALSIAKVFFIKNAREDQSAKQLFYAMACLFLLCFPVFKLFGHTLLKLPSALLHYIPFLNNIRVPTRWAILLYLFAGLFLVRIFEIGLSSKQRLIAFSLLLLTLVAEYWPKTYERFPQQDYSADAQLIREQEGEVVMTIPFGVRDGFKEIGKQDNRLQYLQTLHHKKMLGGYFSRVSDTIFSHYAEDALCSDLFLLMDNPDTAITPQDYSHFFQAFHPNLVYLREDYVSSKAWELFKNACEQSKVDVVEVANNLFRLDYSNEN